MGLPDSNDPERTLMLLNFLKQVIHKLEKYSSILSEDSTNYIKQFCQVSFDEPDPNDRSATTRYNRRLLAYRSVLARAGFQVHKV